MPRSRFFGRNTILWGVRSVIRAINSTFLVDKSLLPAPRHRPSAQRGPGSADRGMYSENEERCSSYQDRRSYHHEIRSNDHERRSSQCQSRYSRYEFRSGDQERQSGGRDRDSNTVRPAASAEHSWPPTQASLDWRKRAPSYEAAPCSTASLPARSSGAAAVKSASAAK